MNATNPTIDFSFQSLLSLNIDIATDTEAQSKYEIVVVPTIIVFNVKEVKRLQADISFSMKATKKDVQAAVDDILMSDF